MHILKWAPLVTFAAGGSVAPRDEETVSLSLSLETDIETPPSLRSHRVFVGASGQTKFRPPFVEATVGDTIRFEFLAFNHSVSQSTFDKPCIQSGPFDTDFFDFNPQNSSEYVVDLLVTTTNPQWFFCRQKAPFSHCSDGMIFAINPGTHWGEYQDHARTEGRTSRAISAGPSRLPESTLYETTTITEATITSFLHNSGTAHCEGQSNLGSTGSPGFGTNFGKPRSISWNFEPLHPGPYATGTFRSLSLSSGTTARHASGTANTRSIAIITSAITYTTTFPKSPYTTSTWILRPGDSSYVPPVPVVVTSTSTTSTSTSGIPATTSSMVPSSTSDIASHSMSTSSLATTSTSIVAGMTTGPLNSYLPPGPSISKRHIADSRIQQHFTQSGFFSTQACIPTLNGNHSSWTMPLPSPSSSIALQSAEGAASSIVHTTRELLTTWLLFWFVM